MVAAGPGNIEYGLPENKSSRASSTEKRSPDCPECDRVWKAYALATRKNLDAFLATKASTQTRDIEKMKILEHKALEAAQLWALARKAVRDHAATHAGEKPT